MPKIQEEIVRAHLDLPKNDYIILGALAKRNNTSKSKIIRLLIKNLVENYPELNPTQNNINTKRGCEAAPISDANHKDQDNDLEY